MVLVNALPPAINSVVGGTAAAGSRVVTINGSNLSSATRILFDGVPATIRSADAINGVLVVVPPPAPANYQANIVALNRTASRPCSSVRQLRTRTTGSRQAHLRSRYPPLPRPPETEAMIGITASDMTFVDGQTSVGFGSSDIVVEGVWVVSPTLLRANVFVAPGAQASAAMVSVTSGLQTASLPAGFQIQTSASPVAGIGSGVVNADPAQSTVFPGKHRDSAGV